MKSFKNINSTILHIIMIIVLMSLFSFLFSHHFSTILTDRGREFFIPQAILEGYAPYKDINIIYLPLAYYINALIYKILGISIDSLILSQTLFCTCFLVIYYLLSKEFLSKNTSFLLTILILSSCIFTINDLFSYITPYSYSRVYGIFGALFCLYFLVKLLKTNNLKYAYCSALFLGFSICCKVEFFSMILLFAIGLTLYKKLKLSEYLKLFLTFLIFPVITLSLSVIQQVSLQNIIDAANFAYLFSKTEVMTKFLSNAGMYPFDFNSKIGSIFLNVIGIISIIVLCFYGLMLKFKTKKMYIIPIITVIIFLICFRQYEIENYWLGLPMLITILFFIFYKNLIKNDKIALLVIYASIILSQREFFQLSLNFYGTYSFPLLILSLCIIVKKYAPQIFFNVKVNSIVNYVLIILICFYSYNVYISSKYTSYPLQTSKGKIYTNEKTNSILSQTIDYIETEIDKNASILVLPEGNFINFVTDLKQNCHLFMLDRLYHDAYGEKQALNIIKNANNDYIFLVRGTNINNFYRNYLYDKSATLSGQYIAKNYTEIKYIYHTTENIKILKKISNKQ